MSDARNAVLESAMAKGLSGIADKINSIVEPFQKAASTVTKTVDAVSDLDTVVDDVILGKFGNGAERVTALTEAGLNYYRIQNRVNETLNNSFRFTEIQIEEQDKLLGINVKSTDVTKETDKLADSKKELIKQFANMSDAQLRSIGLGPSEIASFRELRNMADMRRFTAHCWSEAEVARRMIPYLFYFSKYSPSHSISLSMYVDSVISCILFSTKCKSGLTRDELSEKTHGVGVDREKQERNPKPEADQKDTKMKQGVRDKK